MSHQFSEHDPDGQAIQAAAGLSSLDRTGWRRWLAPLGVLVVAVAALALVAAAVAR